MNTNICSICGTKFILNQHNQKYCSKKCCKKAARQKEAENRIMSIKKCEICGEEFTPKTSNQKLCGKPECTLAKKRKTVKQSKLKAKLKKLGQKIEELQPRKCIICGELFTPKNKDQILCGKPECRKERLSRQERRIPDENYTALIGAYEYKTKGANKVCPFCGKQFVTSVWNQEYCSRECEQNSLKLKNPNSLLHERICIVCGKSFIPTHSQQIICSKRCKLERRRQLYRIHKSV